MKRLACKPVTGELGVDLGAARTCPIQALEHQHSRSLADVHTRATAIERTGTAQDPSGAAD